MNRSIETRLKEAALRLFSSKQFDDVSVAHICRNAGVSNGIFYWYFKNKEIIWEQLMEDFLKQYGLELSGVTGETPSDRLMSFIKKVFEVITNYQYQFSLYREGQYRSSGYESRMREEYLKVLDFVLGRSVNEAEYIFIVGGLRFLSFRSLNNNLEVDTDLVFRIFTQGVFPSGSTIELTGSIKTVDILEPPQNSRDQLLDAGLKLLGEKKFSAVQISDIVREAGLSVGTFYKHFESKEQFLEKIVYQIGRLTRHYLSTHAPVEGSRLDKEIIGIWNFLSYFYQRRNYYSILREAEFVVPLAVKEYYNAFEYGYLKNLDRFLPTERSLVANYLMGISHYLGVEILFSDRVQDPRNLLLEIGELFRSGLNLSPAL